MKPKISILLPAYKSESLLRKVFIPSLHNSSVDIEVIIYDNGGNGIIDNAEDGIEGSYLQSKSEGRTSVIVIGNGENLGLNKALNKCAEVATGDYFYLPHTDMYLMPNWDVALLNACKNLPPTSYLLCSRSIEPTKGHTEYHIIDNLGMEADEFREDQLKEKYKDYNDKSIVVGARMPFFLHRKLWEKMNGVDEALFSYATDDDLIQETYDKKCRRFWMVYGSLVYHLQGKSNQQQSVDKDSEKPYNYFIEKWKKRGYSDAKHPAYWHPKLINFYEKVK